MSLCAFSGMLCLGTCVCFSMCVGGWMCVDVEVIDHLTELCLPCLVDNENVI